MWRSERDRRLAPRVRNRGICSPPQFLFVSVSLCVASLCVFDLLFHDNMIVSMLTGGFSLPTFRVHASR